MRRGRNRQVGPPPPARVTAAARLGNGAQKHRRSERHRDVDRVRKRRRRRAPFGEHPCGGRAHTEPGGQAHRGPAGATVAVLPGRAGELLDPAAADGHRQSESDAAEHPADGERRRRLRAERQDRRSDGGEHRCGQHQRPATEAVGQRPTDQKRGHDAEHVGEQQQVDGERGEAVLGPVHHQQRGELVSTPRNGERRRGDCEPATGIVTISRPRDCRRRREGGHRTHLKILNTVSTI